MQPMPTRKPPRVAPDAALNISMDVRVKDRNSNMAVVAGELKMEEEGDGAKLFESKASAAGCPCFWVCFPASFT